MTKRKTALLDDARDAGYQIVPQKDGTTIYIVKFVGRWKKPVGLALFDDGTALRLDVPLSVATGIRKYNDMRHFLRIKMEAVCGK